MNLTGEIENLLLPVEADQSFQPCLYRGALGFEP